MFFQEESSPESKAANSPVWKNPIARRRISSEGTLEYIGSRTAGATSATSLQRRNYGDVYNRARLLHDFSTKRSLSDSNQPREASRGFIQEALKEKENLKETVESEASAIKEGVKAAATEAAQKEVRQCHDSQPIESEEKVKSQSRQANEIKESCVERLSVGKGDESNNNVLIEKREEHENAHDYVNTKEHEKEQHEDKVQVNSSVDSDALQSDCAKGEPQSSGVKLTVKESVEETHNAEILAESVPIESHKDSLPSLISSKTYDNKDSQENTPKVDTFVESSTIKAEVSDSDFRTSSPWNSQKTSDTFNPESVEVQDEGELPPLASQPVVTKRRYVPNAQTLDHRASLPPNFFSDHVSPVPPPRRNSPRKKLEKLRAGSTEGSPVKTAPIVGETGPSVGAPPSTSRGSDCTRPLVVSTAPPVGSASSQRRSPKRSAPTPRNDHPNVRESPGLSRARPHSIAYLEPPNLSLGSPIAPPRTKRLSRKERQSSAPVSGAKAGTPQVKVCRKDEEREINLKHTEDVSLDEDDMEAQQRKFELDRMRASLFGYDHSEATQEGSPPTSNAVVLTLRDDDDGIQSPRHQNQVVMNVASPVGTSHPRGTTVNISDKGSPQSSKGFKTNIQLDFNDETMSRSPSSQQTSTNNAHGESLDSLINDGHKPYKTIVDLSEPEVRKNKSQAGNSRIVLDLDSHQYRPESMRPDVPQSVSTVTVEEEYMLQGRPALDTGKQVYKTDIYVSPQDSSTYESASNYEESESSTNLDASSLAKSEPDLSDDSDLSDAEGTFQATFEPGMHVDAGSTETRTCIKLDDDGDSGITLVSYHNRSDSLEDEKPTPSPPQKTTATTGVVLTLTPLTSPRTPIRLAPSPPREEKPPAPRFIKMSRSDDSPPKETTALRMEVRSKAVASGPEESGGREGDDPSSRDELLTRHSRSAQPRASPPRPVVSALSPPRHKRPAPTPPSPQPAAAQVYSPADNTQVADNKCDNELSAVARTGTTVFHTTGTKYTPQQGGASVEGSLSEDGLGSREDQSSSSGTGRVHVSATGHLHWDSSSSSGAQSPHHQQQYSGPTTTSHQGSGGADPLQPSGAPHNTPDLVQVTGQGSAPLSPDSMDPITGLRKTGPVSAVDKAVKFVAKTEPSFRVKKVDDPSAEVEGERATLIEAMRVRRKPVEWMPPAFDNTTEMGGGKTSSEMLYEQRKAKNELNVKPNGPGREGNKQAPPDVIPAYDTPPNPSRWS